MAATINVLLDLGWEPRRPDLLMTNEADWEGRQVGWEFRAAGSLALMYDNLQNCVGRQLWGQASCHHLGAALQEGADVGPIRRRLDYLERKDRPQERGALFCLAAGAAWTDERRFQEGLIPEIPVCTRCGMGRPNTDLHCFWERRDNLQAGFAVRRTEQLAARARASFREQA